MNTETRTQMEQQCEYIAGQIDGSETEWITDHREQRGLSEEEPIGAYDYLEDVLDIEYRVGSDGEYRSALICVAYGGPSIYIDTKTKAVEGYWWGERATAYYDQDELGIDNAIEELWSSR